MQPFSIINYYITILSQHYITVHFYIASKFTILVYI